MFPKIIITLLCLLLSMPSLFGQNKDYESSLNTFQAHYNSEDSEAIFNMCNKNMQAAVGKAKINKLINNFYTYFGTIIGFTFVSRQDIVEKYIVQFENGKRMMSLALDEEGKISGLLFKPLEEDNIPKFERNSTAMRLPFKGAWYTYWGGNNKQQNYHVISKAQKGAFDFVVVDKYDKTYTRSGTRNEDYYAFGKPTYAICDAEVVEVITGVEDNRPTLRNSLQSNGNSVMLKTAYGEFISYAHLQKETIKVKKGQFVKKGQLLGLCGNSGNSSEPHLHVHIQDKLNPLTANGVVCNFEELIVNGELRTNYSPVKGDRISLPNE